MQKKKVLDIIISGKGVIPYEKINSVDSLNIKPKNGILFLRDEFYSTLKEKVVGDEEYNNSKALYTLLKMRDLSDLNDLFNPQDVILLLEIMENRFQAMCNKSMYNPRKCNSAGKLRGCIKREQSKIILALPTSNSIMEIFEKTLTSGFSCVNTRLSFDTEILIPNLTKADYKKMKIDESFKAYKRDDLKVIYRIKLDNENSYRERRFISKILKLDENNQCGFAMTKPMPTGCIKENPPPSWCKFNLLLQTVDLGNKIGHLFVADIEFDEERATEREYMYNEILPPITEKQKF